MRELLKLDTALCPVYQDRDERSATCALPNPNLADDASSIVFILTEPHRCQGRFQHWTCNHLPLNSLGRA
jgi:hypothetical protein